MDLAVGTIVDGKVTGITKFGAFVALPDGKSGMVHISEVSQTYVNDIHDFLTVGQEVKVKVIAVDEAGKINLSIKRTQENSRTQSRSGSADAKSAQREKDGQQNRRSGNTRNGSYENKKYSTTGSSRTAAAKGPQSFDDMLKQFMADSDSKISSIKQYSDHRTKSRRR